MGPNSPLRSLDKKLLSDPHTQRLSEGEIRRQVLIDRLQDKWTLLPVAIGFIAFIYTLLFAPDPGGLPIGLGISIAVFLAGICAFLWNYVVRFQYYYTLKSQELVDLFEAQNLYQEEQRLMENGILEGGFTEINSPEGLDILRSLDLEYRLLKPVLNSGKETDLLSISYLKALVQETYSQGLSVLQDILELERAVGSTNQAQLQSEIAELQSKAAAARDDPALRERVAAMDERIASNQERIRIVGNLKKRVEELLHQARRCESTLGKTRIELAALKVDASDAGVNTVIETLEKTIHRAREVQEELKQAG